MSERVIRNCNECPGSSVTTFYESDKTKKVKVYLYCSVLKQYLGDLKENMSPPSFCPLYPIEDFLAELKWAEEK
jgi:hypothetical protein